MRTDYRCDMCGKHPALYTFTVKVPIDRPRYVETHTQVVRHRCNDHGLAFLIALDCPPTLQIRTNPEVGSRKWLKKLRQRFAEERGRG